MLTLGSSSLRLQRGRSSAHMVGSPVPRLGSACTKLSSIDINNSSHVSRQQILACAASAGQEASVAASDSGAPITTDPFAVIESEIQAQAQQEPDSFDKLGVSPLLQVQLQELRIFSPSPIQAAAIPHVLAGKNCAIQSFTGSGKTLTYLLPALTLALARGQEMMKAGNNDVPVQALVIAPSQELAMQIVRVAKDLLPKEGRSAVQQLIGGANPRRQAEALAFNKPLIVVGTPGRVAEMIKFGSLKVHQCPILVLDEADQLMAPNFAEDLTHLASHAGKRTPGGPRQTILVSATLTPTILSKATQYCPDPVFITAGAIPAQAAAQAAAPAAGPGSPAWGWGVRGWDGPASPNAPKTVGSAGGVEGESMTPTMPPQLQHYFVVSEPHHKVDMLRRCIWALDAQRSLVFMNFQQRLRDTQFKLQARNMAAGAMHGEMDKLQRQRLMQDFRRGTMRTLIVSDVAARGLDVPDCDAVFNLELPSGPAHYAHRAGRTGRMGAPGKVISIVSRNERFVVDKMREKLGAVILEAHVSHGEFKLGPAPDDFRFEDDKDSDQVKKSAKAAQEDRKTNKGAAKKAALEAEAPGRAAAAAAPVEDGDGWPTLSKKAAVAAAPSSTGRAKPAAEEASTSGRGAAASKASPQQQPGSSVGGRAGGKEPAAAAKAAPPQKRAAPADEEDSDSDSDDDSDLIDEADLEKLKTLTRSQLKSLQKAKPAGGSKPKSTIRLELQQELEELAKERELTKEAQGGERKSPRSRG